jgi:glutamate dehydrogenase
MTDEVAELVLANNDANGRMLSRDAIRSKKDIFQFGRAIHFIEREFGRSPEDLNLPDDAELTRRAELGEGLTRPELAVLSAWVKMYVFDKLMASNPKKVPGYHELLHTYFPVRIQESYADDIDNHMLADEIAMTVATSQMVADAGAAFFPMTIETTAATVFDIATAYLKAQQLAEAAKVRTTLEELRTSVSLDALYRAWVMVDAGAREVARYWLSSSGRIPTDDELTEMTAAAQHVYELQHTEVLRRNTDLAKTLADDDITADVALRILKAQYLNVALMVWAEAKRSDSPFTEMVVRHLAIARASRLEQLLQDLQSRPAGGRWDPIALRILHNRYHNLLRALVGRTPIRGPIDSVDTLEPMLAAGALRGVRAQVDAMLGQGDELPSVATLLVLEERLASAIARIRPS